MPVFAEAKRPGGPRVVTLRNVDFSGFAPRGGASCTTLPMRVEA